MNVITEFTNEYRTIIDGTSNEITTDELSGGARISFVFHEIYGSAIRSMDPFDQIKDVDIRTILYNSSGSSPALFVGTAAFVSRSDEVCLGVYTGIMLTVMLHRKY